MSNPITTTFTRIVGSIACAAVLLSLAALPSVAAARIVVSDVNGKRVAPLEVRGRKATVLVFITNDCPIANACAPEIERIYRAYAPKQVAMYLVYVDASLSAADARAHRHDYRYTCPAVLDPNHRLVKRAHARVTPEAAVFAPDGRLLYHGRIDDRAVAFGQVRSEPTRHDLRDALDAYLQGRAITNSQTTAVGCAIADLGK